MVSNSIIENNPNETIQNLLPHLFFILGAATLSHAAKSFMIKIYTISNSEQELEVAIPTSGNIYRYAPSGSKKHWCF
jgi:hypothetical protein